MRAWLALPAALVLMAVGFTPAASAGSPRTVHIIGDSLTVRARAQLAALQPTMTFDAASGSHINTMPARIKSRLATRDPRLMVLAMGTNPPMPGRRPWTKNDFYATVRHIPRGVKIVFVTPYRDPETYSATRDSRNRAAVLANYSNWMRLVARKHRGRICVADWARTVPAHPEVLSPDGTHQSEPGRAVWADLVNRAIRRCSGASTPVTDDGPTTPVNTDGPATPVNTDGPATPVITDGPATPVITDGPATPVITDVP